MRPIKSVKKPRPSRKKPFQNSDVIFAIYKEAFSRGTYTAKELAVAVDRNIDGVKKILQKFAKLGLIVECDNTQPKTKPGLPEKRWKWKC